VRHELFAIFFELSDRSSERSCAASGVALCENRKTDADSEVKDSQKADRSQALTVPEEHDDKHRERDRAQREKEECEYARD